MSDAQRIVELTMLVDELEYNLSKREVRIEELEKRLDVSHYADCSTCEYRKAKYDGIHCADCQSNWKKEIDEKKLEYMG